MKCPCEECILLAICKCRVRSSEHKDQHIGTFSSILQCEILNSYLNQTGYNSGPKYRVRVDKTRIVYNLEPLFRGRYI